MATMTPIYIPSTTAGKTWSITAGKGNYRGTVSAYATEGELSDDGIFSFMVFQDRTVRQVIAGTATAKRLAEAVDAVTASLRDQGFIA